MIPHLSVLGILLMVLGAFIGPVALYAAARGIGQDRKNGDEGGRAGSILSLLLGLVSTGLGIFFLLSVLRVLRFP